MGREKLLGLIAGAFLVAGLVVGLIPVSSGGVSCGSAFVASDDAFVTDLANSFSGGSAPTDIATACESLRSVVAIPAWALLGIGALMLLVAMAVAFQPPKPTQAGSVR